MPAHGGRSDPHTFGLGPNDAGLGSIRPDQLVGHAARPRRLGAWSGRHGFGRTVLQD
jgi:hypothetical protein